MTVFLTRLLNYYSLNSRLFVHKWENLRMSNDYKNLSINESFVYFENNEKKNKQQQKIYSSLSYIKD